MTVESQSVLHETMGEPETETEPETVEPHPALGYTRAYDSFHRAYRSGINLDPIVAPTGVQPDAEFVDMEGYTYGDRPWGSAYCPHPKEFAAYYGVHVQLLPFDHRKYDSVELFGKMQKFLNNRPVTCERVTQKTLCGSKHLDTAGWGNHPVPLDTMCLLAGWWPGGSMAASGTQYMNPAYCHSHDRADCITDQIHRVSMLERAAAAYLTHNDVAAMFGINRCNMREFVARRGIEWGVQRARGRTRLARTAKTIRSWGYKWREIAEALGRPVSTVKTWVPRFADDFSPPPDPNVEGFEQAIFDWVSERRRRQHVATRPEVLTYDEW